MIVAIAKVHDIVGISMPPAKNPKDLDGAAPNVVLFTLQEVVYRLFSRGGIIRGGSTRWNWRLRKEYHVLTALIFMVIALFTRK